MRRETDYVWRLAELMAANRLNNSTDLIPLLPQRDPHLARFEQWIKDKLAKISGMEV